MTAVSPRRFGSFYHLCGKRILDVAVASVLLVVFAPVMIAIWCLIRLTLGAPVLFRQRRPGYQGVPFTMLKFRTMQEGRDRFGHDLPDAHRLTALGRLLRRTSVDELPELLNVLRGEMSLVGPRPLLLEYLPRYSPEQRRRHDVRPGMTGLAQVNGRNDISWDAKFHWDLHYVDSVSLAMDVAILARTVATVFSFRGIGNTPDQPVEKFRGHA